MNLTDFTTEPLAIDALGPQGDGIYRSSRSPIYVDRALPGDRIRAKLRRGEDGVTRADILEIVEPSPVRREAPCPHFAQCGGCTLQHVESDFYRRWKLDLVQSALQRQGLRPLRNLKPAFVTPGSRRRLTFSAYLHRGRLRLGYYRRRSREIVDIETCLVSHPKLFALREPLAEFLPHLLSEGQPADIFAQLSGESLDLAITGPVGRRGTPDSRVQSALEALAESSQAARISWRLNDREDFEVRIRRAPVRGVFGALSVDLPPGAFLQATLQGEQTLVETLVESLPARGRFADLFSGCGTFTGPMLARGSVEAFEAAPNAARALAKAHPSSPEAQWRVHRRDLFRQPLRREELNRFDAIVFDPPRAGAESQARELSRARTRTLIAVSCNPATFARDARILCDGGYWLSRVRVVDQFLWSHHVEMIGVFTRDKR